MVGPGLAVQRLEGVRLRPALVVPAGLVLCAVAWRLALMAGQPLVAVILLAALDLSLLRGLAGRPRRVPRSLIAFAVALAALLAATRWPYNRTLADGSFRVDPLGVDDATFHVGLTWELTHAMPPQAPGLSGVPLVYHMGASLVRAASCRLAGVDPWFALTVGDPLVWTLALALALRALVGVLGGSPRAVALVPFTLLLGDLAWLWAGNPAVRVWIDLLRGNTLLSIVLGNTLVPTLAIAIGCLLVLHDADGESRARLNALAALLAAGTSLFKAPVGVHLAGGLLVALVLCRRRTPVLIALAATVISGALVSGGQGGRTEIALDPFLEVRNTVTPFGAAPATGAGFALWIVGWLLASLAVRVVGLAPALRAVLERASPARVAAGAMALAGLPLMLLLRISTPDRLPWEKLFDETAYFAEQGGVLLWAFTVVWLAERSRAAIAAAFLLVLPDTLQFVGYRRDVKAMTIDAGAREAVEELRRRAQAGDVVMQRPHPRHPPAPMVFGPFRVPYTRVISYPTQFDDPGDILRRQESVQQFFRTTDPGEALTIARELDARWLLLYEGDAVAFDTRNVLAPAGEWPGARLYRILR